jgi:hypothetical protein
MDAFEREIEQAINRHSIENVAGNTPDFIVAKFLRECLKAFGDAVEARERWYGRSPEPAPLVNAVDPVGESQADPPPRDTVSSSDSKS